MKRVIELIGLTATKLNNIYRTALGQGLGVGVSDFAVESFVEKIVNDKFDFDTEKQWHEWKESKRDDGWTYGNVYDPLHKIHPNLVENYSDLPESEKHKDFIFMSSVAAIIYFIQLAKKQGWLKEDSYLDWFVDELKPNVEDIKGHKHEIS